MTHKKIIISDSLNILSFFVSATQNQGHNSLTLKEQILVEILKFYPLQYIFKLLFLKT